MSNTHTTTTTPISQEAALIAYLMQHPEYLVCYSLRGAEAAWQRRKHTGKVVGFVLDMSQYHALNHEIGRTATNKRTQDFLRLMRHTDIVAGGGDEFCFVVDAADEAGFFERMTQALRDSRLYGYVTRVELDITRSLVGQMEAALDIIHAAKEADLPPRWMVWRLNERARKYRLGETKLIGAEGGKA